MPSSEREASRDSERLLKHQHSASSDAGRALVPMWDSSDPDRAPPPLPMNPSSPVVASRPNTSSAIKSAHAALTEKARESAYITNPSPRHIDSSPERSLIKGAAHKRMQSLQTGNVRDLSSFLEGGSTFSSPRSPEKSPTRSSSPHLSKDLELRPPEKESTSRTAAPTPGRETPSRELPQVRPSLRRPPQSILGENTPPQSATMLALQNMASKDVDAPLSNITNNSTALVRTPQTFDAISNQILGLTGIATSLQREMANLSRRSKDNATDLVSLKEATNARDEDIRKSLRELVSNLSEVGSRSSSNMHGTGLFLDSKAHNAHDSLNPRSIKAFSLPRIPSPNSFAASLDRDSTASPVSYIHEGGATIALLEKVLREMGTKEGQELLISRLTEVSDILARDGLSNARKLDDLAQYIKTNSGTHDIVPQNGNGGGNTRARNFSFDESPRLELDFDRSLPGPMTQRVGALLASRGNKENIREPASRASEVVNEDIMKIIRTIKDSVAQGGGLTAEVKALVRELRGEVLGMGREIGRKLEESKSKLPAKDTVEEREIVARVVQDSLEELKQHMDHVLRENRRQSASSAVSRSTVDYQEIYNAVRAAVQEKDHNQDSPPLEKEDIIEAVRDAWENYKPEIEVQHFGLEREELLACLKEGIQECSSQDGTRGASRDEVFAAVVEGLKHFSPPKVETEVTLSREEILDAVRECLEEFEFPAAPLPELREPEITRDDMLGAVREGLHTFDFASNVAPLERDLPESITRDDVLEAVKEGLDSFDFAANAANTTALSRDINGSLTREDVYDAVRAGLGEAPPLDVFGQQVMERLQEIIESMQTEFRAVSDEAKQNVAAHGRDTEQVLDATKDGFEKLRSDIENYVDQAADVTGKDEILESMRDSFDNLRAEVEALVSRGSASSLEAVQSEFEHLRDTLATSLVRGNPTSDKEEIIEALRAGVDSLRADIERPRDSNESVLSSTGEILDALQDGLNTLRIEVERIWSKPVDMTVNYEILDTLKAGLEEVRAEMERLRESGHSDRAIAEITAGAVITGESLKRNDIENLEILITQLRIKVEALESMPPPPPQPVPGSLSRDDLAVVEETLRTVQESVANISIHNTSAEDGVKREDVEAIETLLRNTKAKIDEMDPEQAVKRDQIDLMEALILETKDNVSGLASQFDELPKKDDVNLVEVLVRDIATALEVMKEGLAKDAEDTDKVTKTDVEAVEAVCLDVKTAIEQMLLPDIAALASKDDVKVLGELVKEFKDRIETHADTNGKAFEDRQAEIVVVGERVTEIKSFLEEFKDAMKEKLDEGATSVEALGKFLETLGETIGQNATITDDIKTLAETMREEFEKSNAGVVGTKLEADEKFDKTWTNLDGIGMKCDGIDLKIEEKFSEILARYDDAQINAETRARLGEEKNAETEAAVLSTKAVAEELKLFVQQIGATLTESAERTEVASKTAFSRIDDTFTRVEETHADAKAEHQLTREQVFKTLNAVEGVHSHATEYNPKILESIKDVLLIVGQHYEHSKSSITTIQEKIDGIPPPPAPIEVPLLQEAPVPKYDDAQVHEKLDKLVDHMHVAGKSFAQLDMLDKIHQQVMQTASEVSEFVAAQTQRIANDHEDKERALEDATIALEKRLAQKESVEAHVVGLREEEGQLKESVSILKAEQEDLAYQKMKLSADVSSLETALRIRREELHAMEARAEGLERRILEGVIDHSRALLLTKSNKGRDMMSRKRVPSHATSTTGSMVSSVISRGSYNTQSAVSLAMSGNRAIVTAPIKTAAPSSRRILSLNQITGNVPNGASAFKRSHSVKTPAGSGALRKSSWGGSLSRNYGDLNKENLALKETEEEDDGVEGSLDDASDSGTTTRRSSRGTTILTSTGIDESVDEGTDWTGSTDGQDIEGSEVSAPMVLYAEGSDIA